MLSRYLVVGAAVALLNAVLVEALHAQGFTGLASGMMASCVIAPTGFLLQRYVTFQAEGPWLRQFGAYVTLAASNVPICWLTLYVLIDVLGANAFLSTLVAIGAAAVVNYAVLSRLIFRHA
jgi:putative flippase GtrA